MLYSNPQFHGRSRLQDAPIPKMMVPTGLDAQGRPTSVLLWGRGVPADRLFDDKFATTHDIEFLHTVRRLVEALHDNTDLQRRDPPTVAASLAPGSADGTRSDL